MKNTVITCKSEEEMKKVLKELDKTEVRWAAGEMPSKRCYWANGFGKLCITFDKITTREYGAADYAHVTGENFLRDGEIPPIVIYFKDNETIALDKETGKKGIARCHPSDEFDRITGATIALTRLAHECGKKALDDVEKHDEEKTSEPKFKVGDKVKIKKGLELHKEYCGYTYIGLMDKQKDAVLTVIAVEEEYGKYVYKCSGEPSFWYTDEMIDLYEEPVKKTFKVGDRVRVREWDDMAEEFDHTAARINCKFGFIDDMRQYCGKIATIKKIIHGDIFKLVFDDESSCSSYIFSTDMIEPAEEKNDAPKFKVGDIVRVRQWDDMKEEFGIDEYGGITCNKVHFVDGMRKLCGKKAVVSDIIDYRIDLDFIDDVESQYWVFSAGMIEKVNGDNEPVKEPDIKEGDRIVVTDDGKLYTTYSQWVETQDLPAYQKYRYDYRHEVDKGTIGRVIKIAEHGGLGWPNYEYADKLLVYFEEERTERCYLIGIDGVKKVEE